MVYRHGLHWMWPISFDRSSQDDYCPPDQVDDIMHSVLEILQDLYLEIGVTSDYEWSEENMNCWSDDIKLSYVCGISSIIQNSMDLKYLRERLNYMSIRLQVCDLRRSWMSYVPLEHNTQ
jgi:hypothetical protein